ncbi:MAG TPA: hypothetical protein DCX06_03495 [Opitutae bacterium]|nr:hypothetical protein [Opitutae bacterium]
MKNVLLWRRLLYLLVLTLIFEGLLRKLLPSLVSQAVFFLKDGICLLMLILLLNEGIKKSVNVITGPWVLFLILLFPVILNTLSIDPLLVLFGGKQYLLFPIVAVAAIRAFPPDDRESLRKFGYCLALLVLPTTAVALLQLSLPSSHWLNQGIGGTDLSGFSSGGILRVSSTFPFVAQFAMYLNAMVFGLGLRYVLGTPKKVPQLLKSIPFAVILVAYIISVFATGSRTSVLGAMTMFAIATSLALMGNQARTAKKVLGLGIFVIASYFVGKWIIPDAFVVYERRSSNDLSGEVEGRFEHAFINWRYGLRDAPPNLLGYGLGVMSNGSEKLSPYANSWRERRIWGEADLPNTLFEGGWWLVITWMGLRFYIIVLCVSICQRLKASKYHLAVCAASGYIVVTGITGSLGIQPPQSIWFWLAVGLVFTLERSHRWDVLELKRLKKLHALEGTHSAEFKP